MGFSSVFNKAKKSSERTSSKVKNAVGKAKNRLNNFKNGFTGKGRTGFFSATQKYNRKHEKKGGYAGGWAAIAFGNIINAHSSAEDIVEEFGLDKEENPYNCDAYTQAYQEQYDIAEQIYQEWVDFYSEYSAYDEIEMLTVEEFIDYETVEINAFLYACDFVQTWIDGEVWIPSEVLDWSFYEVSDHNK